MRAGDRQDPVALDQVEELLQAYAASHLAPKGPILRRIRAAVMVEAERVAAVRAAGRPGKVAPGARPARSGRLAIPRFRLASFARTAFALGFAGILAVGTGLAVTAAPPGSPFYNARVALEEAFLPAEINARLASHEQHLDERLVQAEAAAARGDVTALAAALAAYQAGMDQTLMDVGDDYERLAHLQTVLEGHLAKLTALSLRLPDEVSRRDAVEHAIHASQKAVTKVKEKKERSRDRQSLPPRAEPNELKQHKQPLPPPGQP